MVYLLEVPMEVNGDYVIVSYFQIERPEAMHTSKRLREDRGFFFEHTKSAHRRSAHGTEPPTATCNVALWVLLTGGGGLRVPWIPPDTT